MRDYNYKGGFEFNLLHGPEDGVIDVDASGRVAYHPRGLKDFKPKIAVKVGDTVKSGDVLFFSKANPNHKFVARCSGEVVEIKYGPRRRLDGVVIHPASDQPEPEAVRTLHDIKSLSAADTIQGLVDLGLWSQFKAFPTGRIAAVPGEPLPKDEHGHDIKVPTLRGFYVQLSATEPHVCETAKVFAGREHLALAGLSALKQTGLKVVVAKVEGQDVPSELTGLEGFDEMELPARYPSDNGALQSLMHDGLLKDETVVSISPELLLDIGYAMTYNVPRNERTYMIAGDGTTQRGYGRGPVGLPVLNLRNSAQAVDAELRYLGGGLLTGRKLSEDDYLGADETAVHIQTEDKERTPFVFFRGGADRLTSFRLWLSALNPGKKLAATTSNNGEHRGCVQCGKCIEVCPVELMPNIVFKAALAEDIERMEQVGVRDCVDCGLCTFVCPSKIELGEIIEQGKDLMAKEG